MTINEPDNAWANLPVTYRQPYQGLKLGLEDVQATLAEDGLNIIELKLAVASLQSHFQSEIWPVDTSSLEPVVAHQLQSLNVEIDKQFRLLTMDVMFLQAARQATTIEQRQGQIRDRLTTLIRYCNAIFQ
jgi:hypothetical protein